LAPTVIAEVHADPASVGIYYAVSRQPLPMNNLRRIRS